MRPSFPSTVVRAAALGLAAGSRGTLGPSTPLWARARAEGRTRARRLAVVAVAGELAVDKVPGIPGRTEGPGTALRALSGAAGGALLAREFEGPVALTAGLAAAVAPVGAAVGVRWRARWSAHHSPWVGALLEDAVALTLARIAVSGSGCRSRLG